MLQNRVVLRCCFKLRSVHLWSPGEAKWRKSASHHVRTFLGPAGEILAAREGRSSGFLEAPEAPADGSDVEYLKFLEFTHVAVFDLEIAFGEPWGPFPGHSGLSRAILGNFFFCFFFCFFLFEFRAHVKFPFADPTLVQKLS